MVTTPHVVTIGYFILGATVRDAQEGTFAKGGELVVTTPGRVGDLFDPACSTRRLLDRIGDKWTSMLVKTLAQQHPSGARFAELRRATPGISHKMLSQTLQRLVADGLVDREVEDSVPPAVHYRLTGLGLSLDEPLGAIREWAEQHMGEIDDHRRAVENTKPPA
jgi:DNA-binding HxlR family transcriptional regulator